MLDEKDIEAISQLLDKKLNEKIDPILEHLDNIETSVGMLAEWADNVAIITKVPFASGDTNLK